jgi:DNA-binding CsgD family transcriptional regulator
MASWSNTARVAPAEVPDGREDVFRSVLQTLSEPLMVLCAGRRVHFANAAADAVLQAGEGLSVKGNTLVAEDRDLQARLTGALAAAAIAAPGETFSILMKQRPDGRCAVLHLSFLTDRGAGEHEPRILGKICLNATARAPDIQTMRQAFGLSQAEAEIALLIAAGDSPRRIADKRASSEETVRWHIKNIFSKTYTSRLVDLALQLSAASSPFFAEAPAVPRKVHGLPARKTANAAYLTGAAG